MRRIKNIKNIKPHNYYRLIYTEYEDITWVPPIGFDITFRCVCEDGWDMHGIVINSSNPEFIGSEYWFMSILDRDEYGNILDPHKLYKLDKAEIVALLL